MIVMQRKIGVLQDTLCPVIQDLVIHPVSISVIHPRKYTRITSSNPYYLRLVLQSWLLLNFRILKFSNNIILLIRTKKKVFLGFFRVTNERSEFVSLPSRNTVRLENESSPAANACGVLEETWKN